MRKPEGRARLSSVALLLDARRGDPLYGDRYAARAADLLRQRFPEAAFEALRNVDAQVAGALREGQLALLRGDWVRVRELASQIASVRRSASARRTEVELAREIYGTPEPPIDPFSPGFGPLSDGSTGTLAQRRDELVRSLGRLEEADPDWAALYAERRAYFDQLPLRLEAGGSTGAGAIDADLARQEALAALRRGDAESVAQLANRMLAAQETEKAVSRAQVPQAASEAVGQALPPFPDPVVERASALGLAHERRDPDLEAVRYLRAIAWTPSFSRAARPARRMGIPPPASLAQPPEAVAALFDQFARHPFVNSLGIRYLPPLESEWVLVEDFAEDAIPERSPLAEALGLDRSRALSRLAIERALRQHATEVLEKLGLDASHYLLTCVPADVYASVGGRRGWARQQRWTHFDGYQVLEGRRLRALVGGDVRFGGVYDVCSIARDDEREGVVTRFAVVRRERMQSHRWAS